MVHVLNAKDEIMHQQLNSIHRPAALISPTPFPLSLGPKASDCLISIALCQSQSQYLVLVNSIHRTEFEFIVIISYQLHCSMLISPRLLLPISLTSLDLIRGTKFHWLQFCLQLSTHLWQSLRLPTGRHCFWTHRPWHRLNFLRISFLSSSEEKENSGF